MTDKIYTGSHSLLESLEHEGVETIFGVPGGAILPAYDPLLDSSIRHVLARHEQGAGHMAEGYAMATGRVGVAMATSGPGATNLITPLQNAKMDSTPLVAITGQVGTAAIGSDAFQEAYTTGLAMHCTKHSYLVTDAGDIPDIIHEAFHIARTGRPGPVLVDVPKDVLNQRTEWSSPTLAGLPGYKPPSSHGHPRQIKAAVELIESAERPVLYVGGGVILSKASVELLAFAEASNVPVVTTLMARGAFPDDHRLALGMPGMHGVYTATTAIQKSDVLIAVGARFDDRVTGDVNAFAPNAKVIHVDVDPAEIGKVRNPEIPIVGDARLVLQALLDRLLSRRNGDPTPTREAWFNQIQEWKATKPLGYDQPDDGPIKTQYFIERLHAITGGDAIIAAGVGQHQMWASQFWGFSKPGTWINSGGLGTMGFAIPAAIGAKAARPDQLVIGLDGDGCFQMTFQELITASTEDIPVKIVVFNNGGYGMVKQWQNLFYGGRLSAVDLGTTVPDYPKLAEALGCVGLQVEAPSEVDSAIDKILTVDDRPVVLEVKSDPDEMCFPMIPAGGSNDGIVMGLEDLRSESPNVASV
ncbi:MAG TPA: biosynthetic-type acetolactate synthase large subunit [Acidimicrobiia bacterium]|nr:biosynthetic-type acetolactate synthase large subunit [Acidimicrobiia bacterium]